MLEKAQSRQQRAAFDFESHYENLCYLSDVSPLRSVKAQVSQGLIDINGDSLRSHDWPPLLDALKTNKSLSAICIRRRVMYGSAGVGSLELLITNSSR